MEDISEYIDDAKKRDADAKGGTHCCHTFGDNVLLSGMYNEQEVEKLKIGVDQLKEMGIKTCRILGYSFEDTSTIDGSKYSNAYILEEKAKGKPLHNRNIPMLNGKTVQEKEDKYKQYSQYMKSYMEEMKMLSCVPQEQYNKFFSDFYEISKTDIGIDLDPSKCDNFFYDEQEGFTIIDLNVTDNKRNITDKIACSNYLVDLIWTPNLYREYSVCEQDKDEYKDLLKTVCFKSMESMRAKGIDAKDIVSSMDEVLKYKIRYLPSTKEEYIQREDEKESKRQKDISNDWLMFKG